MTTVTPLPRGTVAGYPRIGPDRELKRALESYWAGRTDAAQLEETRAELRRAHRSRLKDMGLRKPYAQPEDQYAYDQVLDTLLALGALPTRLLDAVADKGAADADVAEVAITPAGWTVLARGDETHPPLEMTKWFDTNYHYLVPEISPTSPLGTHPTRLLAENAEAREQGIKTRPSLVGPVTFLLLSKAAEDAPEGFVPLDRLDEVVEEYVKLLAALRENDVEWVQLDESALVVDTWEEDRARVLAAAASAYKRLTGEENRPAIMIQASYGDLGEGLDVLADAGVEAVGLDFVRGAVPSKESLAKWVGRTLVAGMIDGHNIWRADLESDFKKVKEFRKLLDEVGAEASTKDEQKRVALVVSTATSLQHTPYSLQVEKPYMGLDETDWLSFAEEKVAEVGLLARGLKNGRPAIKRDIDDSNAARKARFNHPGVYRNEVRARVRAVTDADRERESAQERMTAQSERLNLPLLPTTTIGSFPQTTELRKARAALRKGEIDEAAYEQAMRDEIAEVIRLQEEIGVDVLVHGEAERNDMVQYFAEQLDGFWTTQHGWVQSYGSRCTRPSILWGDVSRPKPMTVPWTTFAQSQTDRPVKAMLTGPVTIMAWSFVRDDQPLGDTADQIALALRDEIADLEEAGTPIIQVDEPALRESLPLRRAGREEYLKWAVGSFRLATSGVRVDTQIHTHLCYSEFGEVIGAINDLNADVTSIEAARSRMELLPDLERVGYARGVGPGVWDIHSPRIPSQEEIVTLLRAALESVDAPLLWVNPDCGLKTRAYPETTATLKNLVAAAKEVRESEPGLSVG